MTNYSNPRTYEAVANWPSGNKTVTARFEIERDPRYAEVRALFNVEAV